MHIAEPVHIDVLPPMLTVFTVNDPVARHMRFSTAHHPYLNDVWLHLVGPSATAVIQHLVCMASDQRTTYISDDPAMSRGFVLDVDRFVEDLDLRPGRDDQGELLPTLRTLRTFWVVHFLVNWPVPTLQAPLGIPLAPARMVAEHSQELLDIHHRYCAERLTA
jgi:hypothetical protein